MPQLEVKRASDRNYLSLNTGTAPSDMLQSASINAAVYLRRTASQAGTPLLADLRMTLLSGRVLFEDSLSSCASISSYFGTVVSSPFGTMCTTL